MSERLLFIAHRMPYPPNKGDKIRSYNILRHLAAKYEIDLFFLVDDRGDLDVLDELRPLVKSCGFDVIQPKMKKILSCFSLLGTNPLTVPYFYSRKLQHKIDEQLHAKEFDHVFCFSSPTAEYLFQSRYYGTKLRKSRLIMDLVDVDSHKWRQYADAVKWPMKAIYMREARQLLTYERRIATEFDEVLLVSEAEKKLLRQFMHADNISAMSNGVDLENFAPGQGNPARMAGPMIVFTGAMDYWPNIDAVVWFADEILPLVRQKFENVQFVIVGSKPVSQVKDLAERKGITVTGFVEDVRDYIAAADICVVPLRVARGMQNKVLEAMAMGKAVVCTPDALEGICAKPEKDIAVAQNAPDFAEKIDQLLDDETRRETLGEHARKCMERHYSWETNLSLLESLLVAKDS